ncbi:thioredoxin domain-containing protein [Vibrio lentus]|uniref:Thioredoxin domain-containing protein n=1 Tax=Vibrio lentus TaxID=136468 RepID=A0A2N7KJK0_9VIBR|nr:thioredoxin domain-containing protein [Vibrio lentus]PMM76255.1 hypothetical protein BCT49_22650 [Vibrio lentus]
MLNKEKLTTYIGVALFVILVALGLTFLDKKARETRRVKVITDEIQKDLLLNYSEPQGETYNESKHNAVMLSTSRFQPETLKEGLYDDNLSPFLGNPKGRHVVVFFTKYHCDTCAIMNVRLEQFVNNNSEGKVIIKIMASDNTIEREGELNGLALFYYKPDLYIHYHHEMMKGIKNHHELLMELNIAPNDLAPYRQFAQDQLEKTEVLMESMHIKRWPVAIVLASRNYDDRSLKKSLTKF